MEYSTYEVSIVAKNGLEFLEVVAVDLQSALNDVNEAFFNVEIVSARLV
jgi:hypothetical protein